MTDPHLLTPNRHNGTLFSHSLEDVQDLARSIQQDGIRTPIRVTPDMVIIDGERRWRAAIQLGLQDVPTIVDPVPEDQILQHVLDCYSTTRKPDLLEKVRVYQALTQYLKGNQKLPAQEANRQAASRAGFSGPEQARLAEQVIARAPQEVLQQVQDQSLTITQAYRQLPKRAYNKQPQDPLQDPPTTQGLGQPLDSLPELDLPTQDPQPLITFEQACARISQEVQAWAQAQSPKQAQAQVIQLAKGWIQDLTPSPLGPTPQ